MSNTKTHKKRTIGEWFKANRTFLVAFIVIFTLMIASFVITKTLPAGEFKWHEDVGHYVLEPVENHFKFWQFICSPFLLFGTEAGITVLIIVVFLFVISGVMEVMQKSKVLTYVFDRIVDKFKNRRHLLLIILVLFFMAVGSLIGCFDEIIPFVPLLIILVAKFGFDKHIGISVSLFAIAAGFAAGIFNPFVVGIPQEKAGVDTFSGMWMRIVLFVVFFIFLTAYVLLKARKEDKNRSTSVDPVYTFEKNSTLGKAGIAFGLSVLCGFIMVILILFVPAMKSTLGSYSLLFLGAAFLIGGLLTAYIVKMPINKFIGYFIKGLKSTLMAGILLVLASSISYVLNTSQRMHPILNAFVEATRGTSPIAYVFLFYFLFLLFSLFISSGSAKAFLLIPIIAPIAWELPGAGDYGMVYPMILAFALADGMASLMYPTNPILIVILNITDTSYGEYIKKNWPFFVGFFVISVLMILFACLVHYGPYPF